MVEAIQVLAKLDAFIIFDTRFNELESSVRGRVGAKLQHAGRRLPRRLRPMRLLPAHLMCTGTLPPPPPHPLPSPRSHVLRRSVCSYRISAAGVPQRYPLSLDPLTPTHTSLHPAPPRPAPPCPAALQSPCNSLSLSDARYTKMHRKHRLISYEWYVHCFSYDWL